MFFTPRYLKHARLLNKGVTRFLNYKRDIIPPQKLAEINAIHLDLQDAIRARDASRIETLSPAINRACERALPHARQSDWVENIEVFFVSIVIAVGIRTYIAQPFQIPTSSMQPTLNGIIAQATDEDPSPGLIGKFLGFFTGTTYINIISDHDGRLRAYEPVTEEKFLIFRPYSKLHFEDGHTITIKSPRDKLLRELKLAQHINAIHQTTSDDQTPDHRPVYNLAIGGQPIRKGQLLARGYVRGGDHVIVNKFAYHFRRPTRGEVFVFTTKNIDHIESEGRFDPRWGSQHYIKRLTGIPGDSLEITPPELFINGKAATEPGIRRVIDKAQPLFSRESEGGEYHGYSYHDPRSMLPQPYQPTTSPRRQYFAMGDNSYFSSDSRYFGPVPEQNLVGPGWLCYWPLTSHWGVIR